MLEELKTIIKQKFPNLKYVPIASVNADIKLNSDDQLIANSALEQILLVHNPEEVQEISIGKITYYSTVNGITINICAKYQDHMVSRNWFINFSTQAVDYASNGALWLIDARTTVDNQTLAALSQKTGYPVYYSRTPEYVHENPKPFTVHNHQEEVELVVFVLSADNALTEQDATKVAREIALLKQYGEIICFQTPELSLSPAISAAVGKIYPLEELSAIIKAQLDDNVPQNSEPKPNHHRTGAITEHPEEKTAAPKSPIPIVDGESCSCGAPRCTMM